MLLSQLIYTVRPCLIHTCHVAPMPCSDHAVLLKATAQHGRQQTAMLSCGLEKKGMVGDGMGAAWQVCIRNGRAMSIKWERHILNP